MEPWEIEQLRRSIAMLPEGHSAGALTKDAARTLIAELISTKEENARYREIVYQLRDLLASLDSET